jgi:hypothetical protein
MISAEMGIDYFRLRAAAKSVPAVVTLDGRPYWNADGVRQLLDAVRTAAAGKGQSGGRQPQAASPIGG